MLIGGLSQVKQSRLQQLVDWCGGQTEFDGCLIFDECHKAKHFIPVRIYSVSSLLKLRLLPMMFDLQLNLISVVACGISTPLNNVAVFQMKRVAVVYDLSCSIQFIAIFLHNFETRCGLWLVCMAPYRLAQCYTYTCGTCPAMFQFTFQLPFTKLILCTILWLLAGSQYCDLLLLLWLILQKSHVGFGHQQIWPVQFLARYRKRRLNQALSVLLSHPSFIGVYFVFYLLLVLIWFISTSESD